MNARLPIHLMLVEDERIVALDLKTQLRGFGYEIDAVVATGEQALSHMSKVAPDLVLMDIHLEGAMDGIEAATRMQSIMPTPVVFLTAYADDETLHRALESQPFGYLMKPCGARELHATIQMALARRRLEHAVERSELRLKLAIDAASLGVVEWDSNLESQTGMGPENARSGPGPGDADEPWRGFLARVHPDDLDLVVDTVQTAISNDESRGVVFRTTSADGHERHIEARVKPFKRNGVPNHTVAILRDITELRRDQERLRQSSVVFHTIGEAIAISDREHRITTVNAAFTRITGYSEAEAVGADPDALLRLRRDSEGFLESLASGYQGFWQGEVHCRRRGGERFPAWQSVSVVRDSDGTLTHYVTTFSDISAIHAAHLQLAHLAHHDPLTGLPNRLLFDDRYEHALEQARRQNEICLVLFIDLDGFKIVNDTLGHAVGDELLREVSTRITRVLRSSDTIARLGGDEFVVLAEGAGAEYGALLAQKILDALRVPIALSGERIVITGSIGIAVFPEHGNDRHMLLSAADAAMYSAKMHGRNRFQLFSREMSERITDRMRIEQDLRKAISSDALSIHYQPQLSLIDGRVVGVEALLRWPHPELGMIPPARYIPTAEDSGVIDELGRWVMRRACSEIAGLVDSENRQLRLAVNVSAHEFTRSNFVATVREILTETHFPAESFELEITESTLQVIERSLGILNALKEIGISISIDDFGTGYSSLSVLRDLPVDRIKIDHSFIVGLPHHVESKAIVEAIVALSQAMHLHTVVEGIERVEQAEALAAMGCDEAQGFLYSRALPFDRLFEYVRQHSGPVVQ